MAATTPCISEQQWTFETPAIGGIVVGFDGSEASRGAIETAAMIATDRDWPVHVVSILPAMSSYRLSRAAGSNVDTDKLRIQLREAAIRDAIGRAPGRECWTQGVAIGKPADEIAKAADEKAARLIILGRSQRHGVERLLAGETTTNVIRCSTTPVLLVDGETQKPSTVVVGVDFRTASARAAAIGLELLDGSGTLYLVHVEEPVEVFPDGTMAPESESADEVITLFHRVLSMLKIPAGVVVETIVLSGAPVPALIEFSERVGADLLAVGSRRLPTMARVILGSVSVGLARKLELPLVIAPAR
jgi:nucleotide-binding universal stress UspA family protein